MTKTLEQAVAEAIHDADIHKANYGDLAKAAIAAVREWEVEVEQHTRCILGAGDNAADWGDFQPTTNNQLTPIHHNVEGRN